MKTEECLAFLQEQIHTTVGATNNEAGLPVTCAVDLMDRDENGLYFLTAKGKNFYRRLTATGYLSLTGMTGGHTMSSVAVSVCGKVREIGNGRLQHLLDKNPYMYELYPTAQSREALTVFCFYEGTGEWFDLSKKPIERFSFSFGGSSGETGGYFVDGTCTGCGKCFSACPQGCIVLNDRKAFILQEHCLRCGNCMNVCPGQSVRRK